MQEIKINKQFNSMDELNNYCNGEEIKELIGDKVIIMVNMDVNVKYGIESVFVC